MRVRLCRGAAGASDKNLKQRPCALGCGVAKFKRNYRHAWRSIMQLPRRKFLHLVAGAAALPALTRIAWAQTHPSRPLRLIVGYAPGGATDIVARLLGLWLSERLGQSVIVEIR